MNPYYENIFSEYLNQKGTGTQHENTKARPQQPGRPMTQAPQMQTPESPFSAAPSTPTLPYMETPQQGSMATPTTPRMQMPPQGSMATPTLPSMQAPTFPQMRMPFEIPEPYMGMPGYPQMQMHQPPFQPRYGQPYGMAMPQPAPDLYAHPQSHYSVLRMIQDAIKGEDQDRMYFEYLINAAPTQADKTIIQGMLNDVLNNINVLSEIYTGLTGQALQEPLGYSEPAPKARTYCEGLQNAMLSEDQDVQDYTKLLYSLQDRRYINMLTGVIMNEVRHTNLLNHLYINNRCDIQSASRY